MKYRIEIEEDRLFPVQAFLNAIPDGQFLRTLRSLVQGVGATFNDADCSFPGDLDPCDEPFDGVSFGVLQEEVVISRTEFAGYLRRAALEHVRRFPSEGGQILELLDSFDRLAESE